MSLLPLLNCPRADLTETRNSEPELPTITQMLVDRVNDGEISKSIEVFAALTTSGLECLCSRTFFSFLFYIRPSILITSQLGRTPKIQSKRTQSRNALNLVFGLDIQTSSCIAIPTSVTWHQRTAQDGLWQRSRLAHYKS